ncbi:hypothetical protein HK099_004596 [Clydaea vesicula]|uniref:T-complex protein 11 n=1 Tax=Clydaea vesicula TaxID=447962 RepID=A0AAD5XYU8_9FUNG|nr:hypothetical protein HK099_004596 [Clydaea vesicula]
MEQTESGFYVINVLPLKKSAGKPKHLEARLASREKSVSHYYKSVARRKEFLENRKAKLHDRGIHVQKIVENHKFKSSGENNAKLTKIADSINAAEKKRTSILQDLANVNARKVAHAKSVALEHQKKYLSYIEEKKAKIEAKEQLVSNRRQRLLLVPRSRLLDLQDWSLEELQNLKSTLEESAQTIQNWWTIVKLSPLIKSMNLAGVTFQEAKNLPFDNLIKKMQDKSLIEASHNLIDYVKKTSPTPVKWRNASRVFLSAYMIASHPQDAMPVMGDDEKVGLFILFFLLTKFLQVVQIAAISAIEDYEKLSLHITRDAVFQFFNSLSKYYLAFEDWKKTDTKKIVDGMIAHWLELEKLWLSVRHTQIDAEVNWKPKITFQQKSIQSKLAQFGVSAIHKLKKEQKKMREGMQIEVEVQPDTTDDDTSAYESEGNAATELFSTSPQQFPTSGFKNSFDSVKMSRKGSSASSSPVPPLNFDKQEILPKELPTPTTSSTDLFASETTSEFGAYLSNEQLAHEIVRNPDYELKPVKKSKLEEQVTAMAKKAFFDAVRQDFSAGIYLNYVPSLLEDIKKQLLSMLSEKGKLATEIKEHLDIDLIKQQITRNVFDSQQCIFYIVSKLLQLCAPVRDQTIRNITNLNDVAAMFEACLNVLEEMKLDLINYKLKSLAPVLKNQAVEYEKSKFKAAVDFGAVKLVNTEIWLRNAFESLNAVAIARNPEKISNPENQIRFEDVYNEALMNVIFSNAAVNSETLPETLRLDANYLFQLQNTAQLITIVAALVMLAKNASPELRRKNQLLLNLRNRLFSMLKSADDGTESTITIDNLVLEIIKSCNEALCQSRTANDNGKDMCLSAENENLIKAVVTRTLSSKDKLYSLLSRRVQNCVRGQLSTGSFKSVTGASLASVGLDIVEKELVEFSKKVYLLGSHNKLVHSEWYDGLLKSIVA